MRVERVVVPGGGAHDDGSALWFVCFRYRSGGWVDDWRVSERRSSTVPADVTHMVVMPVRVRRRAGGRAVVMLVVVVVVALPSLAVHAAVVVAVRRRVDVHVRGARANALCICMRVFVNERIDT